MAHLSLVLALACIVLLCRAPSLAAKRMPKPCPKVWTDHPTRPSHPNTIMVFAKWTVNSEANLTALTKNWNDAAKIVKTVEPFEETTMFTGGKSNDSFVVWESYNGYDAFVKYLEDLEPVFEVLHLSATWESLDIAGPTKYAEKLQVLGAGYAQERMIKFFRFYYTQSNSRFPA